MHELSLAHEIVRIVQSRLPAPDTRVTAVTLEVGEMRQVIEDTMQLCFQSATQGTSLEGATLTLEYVPLSGQCKDCNSSVNFLSPPFRCPKCGSENLKLDHGFELNVKTIETS